MVDMIGDTTKADDKGIDRRSFIKGVTFVGALTAAGGLPACSAAESTESGSSGASPDVSEQVFVNGCHTNCSVGCSWDVTVRDGYIVNCEPHEFEDDVEDLYRGVCARGYLNLQRIYDAQRLKYPMKRVNPKTEPTPEWEQITWNEAIDLIVEKWSAILKEQGPLGIGFWKLVGNYGLINGIAGSWSRLGQALGATNIVSGLDGTWMGLVSQIAGGASTSPDSLRQTETHVFWGNNTAETKWPIWRFANDGRTNHGAKIYTIDPVYTITAARSDKHITIKPATDAVLAMSLMQVIFENHWENTDFIQTKTCAPYLVKDDGTALRESDLGTNIEEGAKPRIIVWDNVSGSARPIDEITNPYDMAVSGTFEVGGFTVKTALDLLKERVSTYTPEVCEQITSVPVATTLELAEAISTKQTNIWHQNGYAHYKNSPQAGLALYALICITGSLGKPGSGLDINFGYIPINYEWMVAGAFGINIPDNKLLDIAQTGELDGNPVPLKSVINYCGNAIGSSQDRKKFEAALATLDFVVVAEYVMTDTTQFADLVLPVSHWWERDDVIFLCINAPYARIDEKVVEPQFEAKSDFEIVKMIADKLGVGEKFKETPEEELAYALSGAANEAAGITWEALKEKKTIRTHEDNSVRPVDGSFPTENGRVNFYLDHPVPMADYGQKIDYQRFNLPAFEETAEVLESSPLAEKYPLLFFTPHTKYGGQTTFHYSPWLHELLGEPEVQMNPHDAEVRGLADGDYVRLFNDRSELVLKVKYNGGVTPGITILYHGWSKQYFKKGHYQELSTFEQSDQLTHNASYFDVRVQAEPYKEA